jgi:Short C-terminal domain
MLRRSRAMARTMGRTAVIAGTATAVSGHVAHRQQARHAQQAAPPAPSASTAPPAPAAEPEKVDVVEQLKRFAELRDQGILTEEEFAAQKAKLLNL